MVFGLRDSQQLPSPLLRHGKEQRPKGAVEDPCCADGQACAEHVKTETADIPASSNTKARVHALEDNINAWEGYDDWAAWDL